jgi:hypothetical protein
MAIGKLSSVETDYNNRLGAAMAEIKALRDAQEQSALRLEGSQQRLQQAEREVRDGRGGGIVLLTAVSSLVPVVLVALPTVLVCVSCQYTNLCQPAPCNLCTSSCCYVNPCCISTPAHPLHLALLFLKPC